MKTKCESTSHLNTKRRSYYKPLFYKLSPPCAICGKRFESRYERKEHAILKHPWKGLLEEMHQALEVRGSSEGSKAPPGARGVGEGEVEVSVLASTEGSRDKGLKVGEEEAEVSGLASAEGSQTEGLEVGERGTEASEPTPAEGSQTEGLEVGGRGTEVFEPTPAGGSQAEGLEVGGKGVWQGVFRLGSVLGGDAG